MKRRPARSGMGCTSRGMRRPLTPTLSRNTGRGRMQQQVLARRGRAAGGAAGVGPEPVIDVGFDRFELTIDLVERFPISRDGGEGGGETGEQILQRRGTGESRRLVRVVEGGQA